MIRCSHVETLDRPEKVCADCQLHALVLTAPEQVRGRFRGLSTRRIIATALKLRPSLYAAEVAAGAAGQPGEQPTRADELDTVDSSSRERLAAVRPARSKAPLAVGRTSALAARSVLVTVVRLGGAVLYISRPVAAVAATMQRGSAVRVR